MQSFRTVVDWVFETKNGTLLFIVRTTLVSFAAVLFLTIPAWLIDPEDEFFEWEGSYASFVVLALVAAPLLENLLLVGLIEFLDAIECRDRTIVVITSVLAGGVHGINGGWQFFVGVGFASMTYAYLIYRGERFSKRYFITVAQHALLNTPATLMMGWSDP